jgi:hypothetical protein
LWIAFVPITVVFLQCRGRIDLAIVFPVFVAGTITFALVVHYKELRKKLRSKIADAEKRLEELHADLDANQAELDRHRKIVQG